MSVPATPDLLHSGLRALWKDTSLDSAGTHVCGPIHTGSPAQDCTTAHHRMGPILDNTCPALQSSAGPASCTLEGSTYNSSLMWPSTTPMGTDSFIVSGQRLPPGQLAGQPHSKSQELGRNFAATAAAGVNACRAVPEELDSDDEDFEVCKLVPEGGAAGPSAAADGPAAAPNIKQFTASSRKLLTSKFRGVCWNKKNKRWQAAINSGGKYIYLGSFQSEDDAARQFDRAAIKIRGKKAKLNFLYADYVDADGNLLDDMEIPTPGGGGSSSSKSASNPSTSKAAKQASQQTPQQQQQSQEPQDRVIAACVANGTHPAAEFDFSMTEAGVYATAERPGMPWQQQPQGPSLWQQYKQQHQHQQQHHHQQQHNGPLLESQCWRQQQQQQQQTLLLQAQHAQQLQRDDAAASAAPLSKSRSLPTNTTVNLTINFSAHDDLHSSAPIPAAGGPPGSEIANQAAMILMQRKRISQQGDCLADTAGTSTCLPGFLHMPGEGMANQMTSGIINGVPDGVTNPISFAAGSQGLTVTTAVGGGTRCPASAGFMPSSTSSMQQQLMRPELTVTQLDLPPVLPLESGSFGSLHASCAASSRPHQQLSMPQGPDVCNPHAAPWQPPQQQHHQRQQQLCGYGSDCITTSSPTHFSDISCAAAAQEYARSVGIAAPGSSSRPPSQVPSSSAGNSAAALSTTGSSVQMQLPAAADTTAGKLNSTGPANFAHPRFADGLPSGHVGAALHGAAGPLNGVVTPGPVASVSAGLGRMVPPGPTGLVPRATAVTTVLSARMASCDLSEALALAQQAAAEQGVADLASALRQMSSGTLGRPGATASHSAGTTNSAGAQLQQQLSTGATPHQQHQQHQQQQLRQRSPIEIVAATIAAAPDAALPNSNAPYAVGFLGVNSASTAATTMVTGTAASHATSYGAVGHGVAGSPPNKTNWPGAATGASTVDGQVAAPSNKRARMTDGSSTCSD